MSGSPRSSGSPNAPASPRDPIEAGETWKVTPRGRDIGAVMVVDEDGSGGVDVEVVVAEGGDAPHPACGMLGSVSAGDGGEGAVGGAEVVAWVEDGGFDPVAGGGVPEQVASGGVDDGRAGSCPDRDCTPFRRESRRKCPAPGMIGKPSRTPQPSGRAAPRRASPGQAKPYSFAMHAGIDLVDESAPDFGTCGLRDIANYSNTSPKGAQSPSD
jgi:hypothetical protein